eukprot:3584658-Ditylum_brightwellii.AAC.1
MVKAVFKALSGRWRNCALFSVIYLPRALRATSVLRFVYIDVASAVKILAPGGTFSLMRSSLSCLLSA